MESYPIEIGIPIPRRKVGRNRKREFAVAAADDIRKGVFNSIGDAAERHFGKHIGYKSAPTKRDIQGNLKDRYKDFRRYIFEELKGGEKTMRIFRIMSDYTRKRRKLPNMKRKALDNLRQHFRMK